MEIIGHGSVESAERRATMTETPMPEIVAACALYWSRAGLPDHVVNEMRAELESHLASAQSAGKSPQAVVGSDLPAFAEAWAREQHTGGYVPTWDEVAAAERRGRRWGAWVTAGLVGAAAVAVWLAVVLDDRGDDGMDDLWLWVWLGTAITFAFGEMVTAGFFLLPFAIGAAAAFLLALLGVAEGVQWAVFLVVSIAALFGLRRFADREDEKNQPVVGANRYIGQRALVLEEVNRATSSGRVRMETEEWRATTTGPPIPPAAEVVVVGVTGARLVVENVEM